MNFKTVTKEQKSDLLAVLVNNAELKGLMSSINKKINIHNILKKEKFEGKAGQAKLLATLGKLPSTYVLFLGLGEEKKVTKESFRKIGAKITQTANSLRAQNVTVALGDAKRNSTSGRDVGEALVEGMTLANYKFTRYKKEKDPHTIGNISFLISSKEARDVKAGIDIGNAIATGVWLARDLINTPAQDMKPLDLAKVAKGIKGIRTKVLTPAQIKKLGMGSYLGVSQGSIHPPAFIEMHYRPSGKIKKRVALVGKGVTFDSGGLSLKPPKSMETMKDDMSGAAAVIGFMSVIRQLKLPIEVSGYVAATENMPDAMAIRPGDVLKAMSGKTIEVLNTDAEGRLTLADACYYASKKKPDYMIDIATLTGACLVALGDRISAIMGNDKDLVNKIIDAGKKAGEKMWELPLDEEYKEELKSPIADLKNIGGPYGGSINGGLFIQEFVGNTKWAHVDIAGPSWTDRPKDYETKGGTGVMVRTFYEFLAGL